MAPAGILLPTSLSPYVVGSGADSNYWLSDKVPYEVGKTYRVRFKARSVGNAGGTAITGPVFCNVDMGTPKDLWTSYGHVFVVPENGQGESGRIRLGQWHGTGRFEFDDVSVTPVVPIYHEEQGMQLGHDEKILVNEYRFESNYSSEGRNHSRSLVSTNASFNTHRWLFGKGTEVTYRHAIASRKQLSGRLEATINYYVGGKLTMEASRDGKEWIVIGTQEDKGTLKAEVPASMYPAEIVDGLRRLAGGEVESDEAVADAITVLVHEEDMEFGGFFKRRNLQFQRHVGVGGDIHVADGEAVHVPPVVGRLPCEALFGRWQCHIGDFLFGCETEDNVVQLIGYVGFDMLVIAVEAEIKPQVIDVVRRFERVFPLLPNAWTPREIVCEASVFTPFLIWTAEDDESLRQSAFVHETAERERVVFAGLDGHVLKNPPEGGFGLTGDLGGSVDDFNRAEIRRADFLFPAFEAVVEGAIGHEIDSARNDFRLGLRRQRQRGCPAGFP